MLSPFYSPLSDDLLLTNLIAPSFKSLGFPRFGFSPVTNFSNDTQWINFNRLLEKPLTFQMENKDKEYELIISRPEGFKDKDLIVQVENNVLTIFGERSSEKRTKEGEHKEYTSFSRSMLLPNEIDVDKIEAKYDNNCNLHVYLPKIVGRGRRQIQIAGQSESGNIKSDTQQAGGNIKTDTEQTGGDYEKSSLRERASEPRTDTNVVRPQ